MGTTPNIAILRASYRANYREFNTCPSRGEKRNKKGDNFAPNSKNPTLKSHAKSKFFFFFFPFQKKKKKTLLLRSDVHVDANGEEEDGDEGEEDDGVYDYGEPARLQRPKLHHAALPRDLEQKPRR